MAARRTAAGRRDVAMTMRSYDDGVSDPLLLGQTIGENLAMTVARLSGHEALVSRHQSLWMTYGELDAAVEAFGTGVARAGIEKGDRVGIAEGACSLGPCGSGRGRGAAR